MRRASKILFCTLTIALVLCSVALPCFASGVYPTEENTLTGIQTLQPVPDGWTYENCEAVAEIVDKAYKLNYFASGVPVAVIYANNSIAVLVVPYVHYANVMLPISVSQTSLNYDGNIPPAIGTLRDNIIGTVVGTSTTYVKSTNTQTGENYPMILYYLNEENTFFPSNGSPILERYDSENPQFIEYSYALNMVDSLPVATSNIIAIRYGENDWRTPYAQGYSDVSYSINQLNEWYDSQLNPTVIEQTLEYQLDIPAIITSVPNGAKQIINNAFGFEIFGINVAGLLSVLLIVTIVAFIIRWLMSR